MLKLVYMENEWECLQVEKTETTQLETTIHKNYMY